MRLAPQRAAGHVHRHNHRHNPVTTPLTATIRSIVTWQSLIGTDAITDSRSGGSRNLRILRKRIYELFAFFRGVPVPIPGWPTFIENCLTIPELRTILELETP